MLNQSSWGLPRYNLTWHLGGLTLLLWAAAIGYLGFSLGHTLEVFLADIKRYEILLIVSIVVVGAGVWVLHWWR